MPSGLSMARAASWGLITILCAMSGCSEDNEPTAPLDTSPPSAVTNLVALNPTLSSVTLRWTAPGGRGSIGTASEYDIRYATSLITDDNWSSAPQAAGEPKPKSAGNTDTFVVTGLLPGMRYYFALKAADEKSHWSALSNVPSVKTQAPPDTIPPSAVGDLAAGNPTGNSVTLAWTAPGDDENAGTAAQYDVRYSSQPITEASWASATQVAGVPKPRAAGRTETFMVRSLASNSTYYFALKTADERPNWSALSNVANATTIHEHSWSPLGAGMNSIVNALTIYNDLLIASGDFTGAGDVAANHIAAWNGESWSTLGLGANGGIYALAVYDDRLIVAGEFTTAGDTAANHIAAWNGSAWSPLESGTNDEVYALAVYDDQLIAGGSFTYAGSVAANCVAAWNGSSWAPLGSGISGTYLPRVMALIVLNDQLIAGGYFTTAGAVSANHIAAWNGNSWAPLGSGMGGTYLPHVMALTVLNGQLVAGGGFTTAGGVSANYAAAWSGSAWASLGSGMNNFVQSLSVYDNQLVAGGLFTLAGEGSASYIAAWDGTRWSPLGSGLSHEAPYPTDVYALTVFRNLLIAAGWFTTAGEIPANSIAAWGN
jgi:hypothetical protein